MTVEPLPRSFYEASAESIAPRLLGHWLLRRVGETWVGGPIVETEAYLIGDPACHGFKRETPRNRTMWGPPGYAYVYLSYGMHFCFNAVCLPAGRAEAVLVRAIEPRFGAEIMRGNRPVLAARDLTNGPAKFCSALDIDRRLDGADLCDVNSPVVIAANPDREEYVSHRPVLRTTRIGLSVAADWPLRWFLQHSPFVSKTGTAFDGDWTQPEYLAAPPVRRGARKSSS